MSAHRQWLKQIVKLGLLMMMGVSMNGCSKTMSWKEEVLLHDGSNIIAERHYNLSNKGAIKGSASQYLLNNHAKSPTH